MNIAVEDENIKLQKDIAEWQSEQMAKAIQKRYLDMYQDL